jgi:hypothetical protein
MLGSGAICLTPTPRRKGAPVKVRLPRGPERVELNLIQGTAAVKARVGTVWKRPLEAFATSRGAVTDRAADCCNRLSEGVAEPIGQSAPS